MSANPENPDGPKVPAYQPYTDARRVRKHADIIESYVNDWEERNPRLRNSHMTIFFREHAALLRRITLVDLPVPENTATPRCRCGADMQFRSDVRDGSVRMYCPACSPRCSCIDSLGGECPIHGPTPENTASLGVPLVPAEPNPCEACPHSYVGAEACKTCTGPESQQQGES
jgi:hypothetical protein